MAGLEKLPVHMQLQAAAASRAWTKCSIEPLATMPSKRLSHSRGMLRQFIRCASSPLARHRFSCGSEMVIPTPGRPPPASGLQQGAVPAADVQDTGPLAALDLIEQVFVLKPLGLQVGPVRVAFVDSLREILHTAGR